MLSSPACFAQYNRLLAAEYSDPALIPIHRLSVDTFAIQHPGDGVSRQAIQSVGLHLAGLGMQLDKLKTPDEANDIMLVLGAHKAELVALTPPDRFATTVADIAQYAGTSDHAGKVRQWAAAAWEDWSDNHAYVIDWAAQHMATKRP